MPERVNVPFADHTEEARQLAEALSDLHYVMSLIVEHATYLIPGEAAEDITAAWATSGPRIKDLIQSLSQRDASGNAPPAPEYLAANGLTGAPGKLKRSFLGRLRDAFLMYWNSEPRTEEMVTKAAEAGAGYFEAGATLASSIPGHEYLVELLSLGSQLLGVRAKRRM